MIKKINKFLSVYLILSFIFMPVAQAQLERSSIGTIKDNKDINVKNLSEESAGKKDSGSKSFGGQQSRMSLIQEQQINIHVLGDVQNPGVYKAKVSDRIVDLLNMAGPNREKTRVVQIRHPGKKTRYYDLYQYYHFGNLAQNPFLRDNDVIFIPKNRGAIRIEGPVARPGLYELNGEKNLLQIVRLAGGFSRALAKSHAIKVIRFVGDGKKSVISVVHDKSSLKKFKVEKGDVYIIPDVINAEKDFDYSVETIPGEHIVYPTSVPDVFVIGAVSLPGPYPYKSHLTVKDYVGFSGASANAYLRSVKVLRNGKKKRLRMYSKIQAGDVIIVREKSLELFLKYVGIAATILSVTTSAIVFQDFVRNR